MAPRRSVRSPAGLATFTNLAITGIVAAHVGIFQRGLTPDTSTSVTISAGVAHQIAVNAGNGQTATVNTAVTTPPSAIVRDISGDPVSGVAVTLRCRRREASCSRRRW